MKPTSRNDADLFAEKLDPVSGDSRSPAECKIKLPVKHLKGDKLAKTAERGIHLEQQRRSKQ